MSNSRRVLILGSGLVATHLFNALQNSTVPIVSIKPEEVPFSSFQNESIMPFIEPKSGRESRRERRKNNRKSKKR